MEIDLNIIKVIVPFFGAFLFGVFIAPKIIFYLHKYKVWRKKNNQKSVLLEDKNDEISKIINKINKDKKTPRMGGIVIIFSVFFVVFLFWAVSLGVFGNPSGKIDFLSRNQTWIPLVAFSLGAFLGFFDDLLTIKNIKINKFVGLPLKYRIIFVTIFSSIFAWWFYVKLGYSQIWIPFYGNFELNIYFIPFFILVFISVFATSNIDGLDGLSGGIMAIIYSAMGVIAFHQDFFNISALSFVIVGSILAFLWFNISPAKFYMTEIGYNALSFCLVIIAFITNTVILLPIIAFLLFVTLISTVLQVFSVKVFKKRIFKIAPLHHHFEACGWSQTQIVLRYWIISSIFATLGVILFLVSF